MEKIIECVPNFSEGCDADKIKAITEVISNVPGVRLLHVDPGKATNRTVVTFVGSPEAVIEAAFQAIAIASRVIDMRQHKGEHPRMGATDVCPLIPIRGISLEETAAYARQLAQRVGQELEIPVYLYEAAASKPDRKNLATIRAGEYEGLADKLKDPEWQPDFGPAVFVPQSGATVIGARDFLIAYNVNLNTTSVRRANSVAFDVREQGRIVREGDPVTGKVKLDEKGEPLRVPGACKAVKAIGWFIEEYGIAQVSMNLTDIQVTPLHEAFAACCRSAEKRGMRVTGSELVGLVPLKVLTDAGRYFLHQQQRSSGVSEAELVRIAVKTLGLDELSPFKPEERIIEYLLKPETPALVDLSARGFAELTASESPAPGGGSVAAYVGSLGASLGAMVANLSAHKRGWDDRWLEFSHVADQAQALQEQLLFLVDEDTRAFQKVMEALSLPKGTDSEKAARKTALNQANQYATEIPLRVAETAVAVFPLLKAMVVNGNPNSISDGGVGVLCCRAAVHGAAMNVMINAPGLADKALAQTMVARASQLQSEANAWEQEIIALVMASLAPA